VRVNRGVWLLVCLFLGASLSVAQSPNGTISGIVLDPSGGLIVGANVLIINNATGVEYPGKANSEGYYVVPNIPPGTYRIQVSNSGFKTIIKPDIVVHVEDALAINFTLPIGAASEIVTVQGGAPLINTENASVGTIIDRKFVENLPLNGRSFNTLLQLTPGVVIAPASYNSPGQFSIAGQRGDANSFSVDGVSANFGVTYGLGLGNMGTGATPAFSAVGGTSSLVSVDALQEFRVETSSFAPEFGRQPGGQVVLTSRSGTNDFHGGAFDYFRNTVMDANDWFANQAGNPRAPEHHNDFGGFLGGPVWKDKTFFFVSYEGARLLEPQTMKINVPSVSARSNASAEIAPFLDAFPVPNGPVTPSGYTALFTGTWSNKANLDATSFRIDHAIGDQFSLFGRFNYAPSETIVRVNSLSNVQTTPFDTETLTIGANMRLSDRISNSLRANYSTQSSKADQALDSFGGAMPLSANLLLSPLAPSSNQAAFELVDANDFFLGPNSRNRTRQFNGVDDVVMTHGAHEWKFGLDYRAVFLDFSPAQDQVVLRSPSTQQFLATEAAALRITGFKPSRILANAFSVYGQDRWKIGTRLTVTYGLRWELSPAPSGRGSTTLASWTGVDSPAQISLASAGTSMWKTTYGNFAPRTGLAYSLTQRADLVLRAGFGFFYDLGTGAAASLASAFPNQATANSPNVPVPINDIQPQLPSFSTQPPYGAYVLGFAPDLKLPRSYQWNLALEKSLGGQQVVSATYVGQAGRDLLRQSLLIQPNANFPGDFLLTQNDGLSNYNALQLQYRRPVSERVKVLLSYTWSHSLDNSSNDTVPFFSKQVFSGEADYSSSDFDVRHSVSGAVTISLPGVEKHGMLSLVTKDWSLDAVVVARTGFPFNANVYATTPDPLGIVTTRPDRVSGQPLWTAQPGAPGGKMLNYNLVTNAGAFTIPLAGQGSEGRNDIPGFGFTQVDVSVARKFPVTERVSVQLRGDAFNVLNHPNFTNPDGYVEFGPLDLQAGSMLNHGLGGLNSLFQQGGPRSLQISLRLAF
jgi:hypothetical protein